jgi:flagellar basal-body rod protein FlgB
MSPSTIPNGIDAELAGPLRALDLRAYRTEVLASNIANADTPNYKARDFDFAAALSGAIDARQRMALARTSARHLTGSGGQAPGVALQYRVPMQPSIDGNTVEMDTEQAQFSDNALRMQADLTFMSAHLRELQMAIQGQ